MDERPELVGPFGPFGPLAREFAREREELRRSVMENLELHINPPVVFMPSFEIPTRGLRAEAIIVDDILEPSPPAKWTLRSRS
jgi:hypothetical protein